MFMRFINLIALVSIAIFASPDRAFAEPDASTTQKAILITGASSGIGRNLAETLAADGYFVYAGARKQADLEALNAIPNIRSVRLDVTKQDEIDAAVEDALKYGWRIGIHANGDVTIDMVTQLPEYTNAHNEL